MADLLSLLDAYPGWTLVLVAALVAVVVWQYTR